MTTEGTNELQRLDLGWFYSNMTWTLKEGTLSLPPATRQITFGFYARRASGSNNDGYLDDAFLFVSPQRPVISSIDLAEETVHLHLANLYPGAIYSVLRAPALFEDFEPGWIESQEGRPGHRFRATHSAAWKQRDRWRAALHSR